MADPTIQRLRKYLLIDDVEIGRRREFFGVDDRARMAAGTLAQLFSVQGALLADDFYDQLLSQKEISPLIDDPVKLERLKQHLQHYFQAMASGDYGGGYVDERLRVGLVHYRVGLEPKWYIGAYRLLLSRTLAALSRQFGDDVPGLERNFSALMSLTLFDMSLALDAYHGAHLQELDAIKKERDVAHAEAQELLLTYTAIINALPVNIALLDGRGLILSVNENWRKFADENSYRNDGYGVGLNYLEICRATTGQDATDACRIADGIELILQRKTTYFTHEYPCHSPVERRWFRAIVTPIDFGANKGAVIMHLDTTHRKERELALWRGANFDSLTNLPNRSLILDRIRQAVHRAKRHGEQLGLLFLDLDHFKQINDKLGHAAGDEVLRVFARRIETCVRAGDSVGRLAGDEFLIVLPGMKLVEDAKRVAGKILDATSHPIDLSGQSIVVTCSIGIAIFPEHGDTAEDLIKRSDVALYAAKASGRDDVSVFSDLEGAPSAP